MRPPVLSWFFLALFLMVSLAPAAGPDPVPPGTSETSGLQPLTQDHTPSLARGEGDNVAISIEDREPSDDEMMRNETHRFTLNVTNTGPVADTYDIAVDGASDGWKAETELTQVSLESGVWERFYLDIYSARNAFSNKDFNISATSRNNPDDYNYTLLSILLDTRYMVDVSYPKDGNETSGNRGDIVIFNIEYFNSGDEPDNYEISYSPLPKDWTATVTPDEASAVPAHSEPQPVELKITVPDNAEVDEAAKIRLIVTSMTYRHIDSDQETITTAADGRTYGITLDIPDGNETTIIPDANTTYLIEITNERNEEDTFKLAHSEATDGWSAFLSQTSVTVPAVSSTNLELEVMALGDAQQDDTMVVTVTAYSDNRPKHRDELVTTTDVRIPTRDLELVVDNTELTTKAGFKAKYHLNLTNRGSDSDSFTLELEDSGNSDWTFTLESDTVDDLAVDATRMLYLWVEPDIQRPGHDQEWANVTATSVSNTSLSRSISTLTTVESEPNFALNPNPIRSTVFPGDNAYFNFSIFNSGNIPDSYTVEVSGDPAGFTAQLDTTRLEDILRGGEKTAQLTVEVDGSVQPKSVKYTVTATSDEDGGLVKSVEVTVEVVPYAEIELTVPSASGATDPGKTYAFDFTVRNRGNDQENFTLALENLPVGWYSSFYQGTSLLTGELILNADAQANLQVKVTPGDEELAGISSFTLRVISGVSPSVEESRLLSLEINKYYAFTLTPDGETVNSAESNKTYTYQFTVTNVGNSLDYYTPTEPTWPADWSGSVLPTSSFSLEPDETKVVTFTVNIPLTAKGGWTNLTPAVSSSNLPGEPELFKLNLRIASRAAVTIDKVDWFNEIYTSQPKTIIAKIINAGNGFDNLTVIVSGAASWVAYSTQSYRLAPGASKDISMEVTVPAGTSPTKYSVTVTVVSEAVDTQNDKTTFTFTVYQGTTDPEPTDDDDDDGGGFIPALSTLASLGGISLALVVLALRRRHNV